MYCSPYTDACYKLQEAWTIIGSQNVAQVVCLLLSSDSQLSVSFVQII